MSHQTKIWTKTSLLAGVPEIEWSKDESSDQAMAAKFVQKPQDGRADTVVELSIAPSFITYNAKTLERVMEFFHSEEVTSKCTDRAGRQ